jgi:hypothetical protein
VARGNPPLVVFNRGRISKLGLARTDLDRTRLSAEVQTNWVPRTLGSMMLRPGLEFLCGVPSNDVCRAIPFVFRADDTAILLVADMAMYVVIDDAVLTRASVTSAILNGTFASNLASWTIADETGATSSWVTGGYLGMTGTRYAKAILRQEVVVAAGSQSVEHALRIVIARGRVTLRVGSTSGDDDYISQTELKTGTHSLAFTPTGNFWVEFQSNTEYQSLVDSVAVESSGTVSIPAPWVEADLGTLRWDQSADVIFVAAEGYQQRRIERRATRSWSVVLYEPDDGPFRSPNTLATRLNPTALTGDVTLQADRPTFDANHVGGLFRVTSIGQQVTGTFTGTDQWSNGIRVSGSTDERQFDVLITSSSGAFNATVRLQKSVGETGSWANISGSTYGSSVATTYSDNLSNQVIFYRIGIGSTYSSGTVFGTLTYASGGLTGVGRVTAVAASTSATVSVLTAFGSTAATETWEEGEWSEYRGFPTAVALHDGRLCWAGKSKIWASVSDAYESFDPDTEGDAGPINRSIGAGPVDVIQGLLSLGRLLVFTQGREIQVKTSSLDEPITPTNFNLRDVSTQGSANAQPVKIDKRAMFVQQGGTRLMETGYSGESLDYETADRTLLVPEMGEPSIVRLAVQRQPDTRVHCVRSDGTVALLVSDPAENVVCWVDIETDGEIEDVAVLPGEIEDDVYYVVKRTIPPVLGEDPTSPSYVGSSSAGTVSSGTTVSATPYVSTAVGDVLIAQLSFRSGVSKNITMIAAPTEGGQKWNRLVVCDRESSSGNALADIWWKYAEASDLNTSLSWTWTGTTNSTAVLHIHTFTGCDANFPFDIASIGSLTLSIGNGGSLPTPSIVTQTANTLLVALASHTRGDSSFTPPSGMTERTDANTGTSGGVTANVAHTMATAEQAAAGATGVKTFAVATGGSATGVACLIALTASNVTTGTAPVLGDLTTAAATEPGPVTISVPSGTVDGDLLIATVAVRTAVVSDLTEPAGWTEIARRGISDTTWCLATYYRIASSEPASYDWSCSNVTEGFLRATMQRIESGTFDTNQPIHAVIARPMTANGTASLKIGGGTPYRHNTMAIEVGIVSGAVSQPTLTLPDAGETSDLNAVQGGVTVSLRFAQAHQLQTTPNLMKGSGVTGGMDVQTWTNSHGTQSVASQLILIGPAPADEDDDDPSSTVRYLEKWSLESEARGGTSNKIADAYGTFNSSDPTTLVTGATHLIATTVCAWGSASSGVDLGSAFVVGATGDFTIGTASTTVIYGLPYTGTYKSAKLAYAAQAGTALTQKKRINHVGLLMADAHANGLQYGPSTGTLNSLPRTEGMARVSTDTVHQTYDRESIEFPGHTDTDARVVLVAQSPRPVTVLGAVIQINTDEKV